MNNPAHVRPAGAPFIAPAPPPAAPPRMPAPEAVMAAAPTVAAAAPAPTPAARGWGRKAAPAPTPAKAERGPVRLRWWLLLLAVVLGLWVWDKPRKIEARVERALALGAECKLNEAQAELIELRSTRATPEQLRRLQQGLNKASADCERKHERARAWRDTEVAVEAAIDDASFIRAQQRLQGFVRKYGEDGDTRSLKEKITAARIAWQNSDAGKLEMEKADCRTRGGRWLAGSCW
ncbi:hypothetical protein ACFSQU_16375 [Massilia sp. GCM10020059]|uniref:DUF1311 domain-containing protein n=1 Tax=Massilia agrisoli TaxID=2892444 RepID=A0ABS8IR75_9BURK|nr:hypothetical protein [Massilia agrisoli]MCC6071114.1 hypothetical protein [Massilia agrisoli]